MKVDYLLTWVKVQDGGDYFAAWNHAGELYICVLFGYKGDNDGKDFFKRLSIQSMEFDSNES